MGNNPGVKLFFIWFFLLSPFLFAMGGNDASSSGQNSTPFDWYMTLIDPGGEPVDYSNSVAMPGGKPFKISIASTIDCYSYVIVTSDAGSSKAYIYNSSLLPERNIRTIIINRMEAGSGKEFLSVIVTKDRQAELEKLIDIYRQQQTRTNFNKLEAEINRVKKENDSYNYKPGPIIPGGVGIRGGSGNMFFPPKNSRQFSGKSGYVWTFIINYQ